MTHTKKGMPYISIVDDDFEIIHSISTWLFRRRYEVRGFSGSKALFDGIDMNIPDVILLDVVLGNEDGRDICKEIRRRYSSHIPIVMFSMVYNSIKELKDSCADDFIKKDITLRELTNLLHGHIKIEEE